MCNGDETESETQGDEDERDETESEEHEDDDGEDETESEDDSMDEENISEEVYSDGSNDEEQQQYVIFDLLKGVSEQFSFQPGMYFFTLTDFKDAIAEYSLLNGRPSKFMTNNKVRVRAICKEPCCKWFVYCAKSKDGLNFQVKSMYDKHTCSRKRKNHLLNKKRLSKKLVDMLSDNPRMSYKVINRKIKKKYHITVTKLMVCKAKRLALDILDGSHKEQFNDLWAYCAEVGRSNPGSSILMKCQTHTFVDDRIHRQISPIFQRLYICLRASIDGFMSGRRPFIGLDGCFIKGPYGGQILVAVAKDPNNSFFPLAYAVVEVENNETCGWFVTLLLNDIGATNQRLQLTFMTDQQKGIITALQGFEHRFCVNHLYNNFKKRFGGIELKKLMMAAAKATYQQLHDRIMLQIKVLNKNAFEYLQQLDKKHWCRYTFSTYLKCDDVTNNICEIFNKELLEYRDLPIVSMVDGIRSYLMRWTSTNRMKVAKYRGHICPKIRSKIEFASKESGKWIETWAGQRKYEVDSNLDKFVVDLELMNCSCRNWDLTGVPCEHAIAAIWSDNGEVEAYVSEYYKRSTYVSVYDPIVYLTNGKNLWPIVEYPTLLPPPYRRMPGRPKKMRKKDRDEGSQKKSATTHNRVRKISRKGTPSKCTRCGNRGHNRRSCKGNGLSIDDSQQSTGSQSSSQPSIPPTNDYPSRN